VPQHPSPVRALIVSATVGAGDAGTAHELARQLAESGHQVAVRDFLDAAPLGIGKAMSKGYEAELRHAPWAYELAFGVWYWLPFLLWPASRVLSMFTRRTVRRWVTETQPDVVISTYPVATQVLGDMRRRGRRRWRRRAGIGAPTVNFITDFGYHPFWAHAGIDLNLAVNPATVAAVAARTGRPSLACAPLVRPAFGQSHARRAEERAKLGLGPDDIAVLVSSGSWGVGDVTATVRLLNRDAGIVPVVVCGRNAALASELAGLAEAGATRTVVIGWTDDMPGLMAACDVLVENAGGLTALEAMVSGTPVVSYRPIPGHGRKSASAMTAAGVGRLARSDEDLLHAVTALGRAGTERRSQAAAVERLFGAQAASAVAHVASCGVPSRLRPRPVAGVARAAAAAALVVAMVWTGLTMGVAVAAAAGAGVAHPPEGAADAVFIGARLSPPEVADPGVRLALGRLDASAVVDAGTAEQQPGAVRSLAASGVDLSSGGLDVAPRGPGIPAAPWALAAADVSSAERLAQIAGQPVTALVPDHSLSAFDLVDASSHHLITVVPDVNLPQPPSGPYPREAFEVAPLSSGLIYLVNGTEMAAPQLELLLDELGGELGSQHLVGFPLSALQ